MTVKAKFVKVYSCEIPQEYLTCKPDELPPDFEEVLKEQAGLPCDGGGYPGSWCRNCEYFGGYTSDDWLLEDDDENL